MATIQTLNEETWRTGLFLDILAVHKSLKNIEKAMEDSDTEDQLIELTEEHDSLTEMNDFLSWQFGHIAGYETLAELRKFWGIQSSMYNVLQEKYYKRQKMRYEDCKRGKKFFTPEDREFIEQNRALNELHMNARWKAADNRELIADIIETAFPEAPFDLGWDEVWVEA
jgi:hypothetical protein